MQGRRRLFPGIIRDEFGLNITVCIEHDENYGEEYKNFQNKCRNTLKTLYTESEAAAAELIAKNAAADAVDERSLLPKFCSIDGPELEKDTRTSDEKIIYFSDDVFKIGNMTFDVSEPSVILGDTFAINPTPIEDINGTRRHVTAVGELFWAEARESRDKTKVTISCALSDNHASINVKLILPADKAGPVLKSIPSKSGQSRRGAEIYVCGGMRFG